MIAQFLDPRLKDKFAEFPEQFRFVYINFNVIIKECIFRSNILLWLEKDNLFPNVDTDVEITQTCSAPVQKKPRGLLDFFDEALDQNNNLNPEVFEGFFLSFIIKFKILKIKFHLSKQKSKIIVLLSDVLWHLTLWIFGVTTAKFFQCWQ
jgi:hypothetical protein